MSVTAPTATQNQIPQQIVQQWDVVVIGAGVAGGIAAHNLAQAGHSTLLVEAKSFPREKVCGCCLNRRGQAVLHRSGLLAAVQRLGGVEVDRLSLRFATRRFDWSIPPLLTTSRGKLDTLLADSVADCGGVFLDGTRATVLPLDTQRDRDSRRILLRDDSTGERVVSARIVLVADGLTQSSLARLKDFGAQVASESHIGVQCLLDRKHLPPELTSRLTMVVGQPGYVGIAPIDGGRVDIAAAISPRALSGGSPKGRIRPHQLVDRILQGSKIHLGDAFHSATWLSTPALTRRSNRVGEERMLLLGDSLGYVEPFTGEGMSWAMVSGELAAQLAGSAVSDWSPTVVKQWEQILKQKVVRKQWMCQLLARLLRKPSLAQWTAKTCDLLPPIRNLAMTLTGKR